MSEAAFFAPAAEAVAAPGQLGLSRDEARPAEPEIILDLSRLLSRVLRAAPTGIDRVEMAYAQMLMRRRPDAMAFAAVHPSGVYGRLPLESVRRFVDDTARRWLEGDEARSRSASAWRALGDLLRLAPKPPGRPPAREAGRPRVYLQISPHHLDRPAVMRRILGAERARLVCMVHDLIPIEFPQYARPGGAAVHRRRIETLASFARGLVAVSEATRVSLSRFLVPGRRIEIIAAPLGARPTTRRAAPAAEPYFVMLGTIEPRKNLRLALDVMGQLALRLGRRDAPRLHVVGARGWERREVRSRLSRPDGPHSLVIEHNDLSDRAVGELLAGARALIMPSFAEGFGLPVAEALAMGTPVICSDIPALREVGRGVPEHLDPADEAAWCEALASYAALHHPRRMAQLARMEAWRAPTWDDHLDPVLALARRVGR